MRRLLATSIITVALLSSGMSLISASPGFESEFLSRVSHERVARGLPGFTVDHELTEVARRHAARMASEENLYHNPDLEEEVSDWVVLGENVGRGPNVDSIHAAFMDSSGHREQILHRDYRQIGVGVVSRSAELWVTQVFVLRTEPTTTSGSTEPGRAKTVRKVSHVRTSAAVGQGTIEPAAPASIASDPQEGHRLAMVTSGDRARPLAIGVPTVMSLRPESPAGVTAMLLLCTSLMHLFRTVSMAHRRLYRFSR